jgi:hypothetical protein
MSSLLVILFGMVKQFCRFWIWSETECETRTHAECGLQHNSTPPTPHPHSHTLSVYTRETVYTVYLVWEGGEVRENVEGQQYTNMVPLSMKAPVHNLGRKYQPWENVSPVYKIC